MNQLKVLLSLIRFVLTKMKNQKYKMNKDRRRKYG